MINRNESSKATWLKYPVFFIAALTVASAFARQEHINALTKYVSKPMAEVITGAIVSQNEPKELIKYIPQVINSKITKAKIETDSVINGQVQSTTLVTDSSGAAIQTDSIILSPSRYIVYQGNRLYWIVTPKTTLDDMIAMKQEFTKHGHIMQLNELKYDPLYAYITRIELSLIRPSGGSTSCNDLDEAGKPISSIVGYVGIGSNLGEAGTGSLESFKNDVPSALIKTASEDESSTNQFVKAHKLDYLIEEGDQKFKYLGSGSATFSRAFFKNKSIRNSGLIANTDGSLSIDEKLVSVKVFVNNEPVTSETIKDLKVSQLYSVVQKTQYNPARKESFTSALLIYTIED